MKKISKKYLFFAGIAGLALAGGAFVGCRKDKAKYEKYDDAARYAVGNFTYEAQNVTEVEIDWVGGSVEVEQSDGQTLTVSEDAEGKAESERLHYYLDGTTLKIRYCESGLCSTIDGTQKNLRVEIPVGVDLDIDCESADVVTGALTVRELSVETKSGNITAEKWTAERIDADTKSGNITVGEVASASVGAGSVSGEIRLGVSKAGKTDVETTSGKVTLELLAGLGARVEFKTKSGAFYSDKKYESSGKRYNVYGADGVSTDCTIEVETGAGALQIR